MDQITGILQNKEFKKYTVFGFMVIFIGVMLFTVLDNPDALNTRTYMYTFSILIPIAIASWFLYDLPTGGDYTSFIAIASMAGVFALFGGMFYLYSNMSSTYFPIINYILNIIIFLGIMIALSMVYNIASNNLNKLEGPAGLAIGILFYIPCMISDFISYMMQQYKLTPNVVLVLFVIEILLILLYIYIPKVVTKVLIPKNMVLQNIPVFLDEGPVTIATANTLYPQDTTDLFKPENPFLKNYSLSMWIFINPQNTSRASYAQETEFFNYSYTDKDNKSWPKPRITYSYDTNDSPLVNGQTPTKDQYHIYIGPTLPSHNITVVSQKWNQFVFNYNNNLVDLFVNGNLERSFTLSELPQYDITDTITIGSPNGLDGAICNVTYTNTPLTAFQIANTYNLLMIKNPPTIQK